MKNLLFIGDVVGKQGSEFLISKLGKTKKQYSIDVTIVNGENSAIGNGINKVSSEQIFSAGADVITGGNHSFHRFNAYDIYSNPYILRPANYPEGVIGSGVCSIDYGAFSVAVINLMGNAFMDPIDNPFSVVDNIIPNLSTPNIFVDFHAEATSEKKAMGFYLDGKVTGVFGTHTHVQTADETILKNGTAYITDVGMTGVEYSCLGVDMQEVIEKCRFRMPAKFSEAQGDCFMCGAVVEFDEKIGKSYKIQRIIIR